MISAYAVLGILGFFALVGFGKDLEKQLGINSLLGLIFIALIIFLSFFNSIKINNTLYFNLAGGVLAFYGLILCFARIKGKGKLLSLFCFAVLVPMSFLLKYYIYALPNINSEALLWILGSSLGILVFLTTKTLVMALVVSLTVPYVSDVIYYYLFLTTEDTLVLGGASTFQIMIVTSFISLMVFYLIKILAYGKIRKTDLIMAETADEIDNNTIEDKIINKVDRDKYPYIDDDDVLIKKSKNKKKKRNE